MPDVRVHAPATSCLPLAAGRRYVRQHDALVLILSLPRALSPPLFFHAQPPSTAVAAVHYHRSHRRRYAMLESPTAPPPHAGNLHQRARADEPQDDAIDPFFDLHPPRSPATPRSPRCLPEAPELLFWTAVSSCSFLLALPPRSRPPASRPTATEARRRRGSSPSWPGHPKLTSEHMVVFLLVCICCPTA